MNKGSFLVFDEFLLGAGPFYTAPHHNARLGECDQLSIHAVADSVGFSGTLSVQVQHSGDNKNFVDKGAPQISSAAIATGVTNNSTGAEPGTTPSLRFVRLQITLGGMSPKAHVRVHVTMRDQGN